MLHFLMTSSMTLNRHIIDNYVIIASLKSEQTSKLLTRKPGLRLWISSLPDSASRIHVESFGKPHDSTSGLEALPGKLDIKRHSPSMIYVSGWNYTNSDLSRLNPDYQPLIIKLWSHCCLQMHLSLFVDIACVAWCLIIVVLQNNINLMSCLSSLVSGLMMLFFYHLH